jgi:hypothetical protein
MAKKEKVTLQELIVQTPELKSSLLKFENVKLQLDKAVETCLQIKVTDENSLAVMENQLGKMNDLVSAVNEMHKVGKKPYLDKCNAYDGAKNYVLDFKVDPIEYLKDEKKRFIILTNEYESFLRWASNTYNTIDNIEQCDSLLTTYKKEVKEERWKGFTERVKAEVEKYKKLVELKKEELTALENATPDEAEAIKQNAEEAKQEIESADVTPAISISFKKTRNPWTYEVVDINSVPKEFLMVDESKVKEYLKANSDSLEDGKVVNGIKYYKDLKVTV